MIHLNLENKEKLLGNNPLVTQPPLKLRPIG